MAVRGISEDDKFDFEIFKLIKHLSSHIEKNDRSLIEYFDVKTSGISIEALFQQLLEEIMVDDKIENCKRVALIQAILKRILFLKLDVLIDGTIDRLVNVSSN